MSINKRILIESIAVSILVFLIVGVIKVIQGVTNTNKYVPDLMDRYTSVNYLQHEVSFGVVSGNENNWLMVALGICILIIFYYGIRVLINRWNNKKGKKKIN